MTLAVATIALVAGALAGPPKLLPLSIQLGIIGWVVLAAALLWQPVLLAPAMVGVALPTAIAALDGDRTAATIAVTTMLLVVTGELAGWSIDRRSVVPEGRAIVTRRATTLAGVAVGSVVLSGGVLGAGDLPAPGGALPVIAGTVAALAVVALAALRRW